MFNQDKISYGQWKEIIKFSKNEKLNENSAWTQEEENEYLSLFDELGGGIR
ncbi:MAG: hypothetical protein LUG16_00510 [Candidatus Gastranaerophilales bacterium]|nr:hypothetical protein [Candidatus Gastranaerophilales bacterium]